MMDDIREILKLFIEYAEFNVSDIYEIFDNKEEVIEDFLKNNPNL